MELLLWRWSTAVQATSLVMVTVFFGLLARSVPLAAVRWWVRAWACNLGALAVTLFFWYFEPPATLFALVFGPPRRARSRRTPRARSSPRRRRSTAAPSGCSPSAA